MYRCRKCHLGFRWPRISQELRRQLYIGGNEHAWKIPAQQRHDWILACDWIRPLFPSSARILDVGCYDGKFLSSLEDGYQRYGIEIHPSARQRLSEKSINIFGSDIDKLSGTKSKFDCITAFDFIEHVESPKSFLSQCANALKPGGYIIISSGNLDALSFRLMGSRYWYCTNAEHLSFISMKWLYRTVPKLGLKINKFKTISHESTHMASKIKQPLVCIGYRLLPQFFGYLRRRGWGGKDAVNHPELAEYPPVWGSAKDHFIVLMKK